MNLVAWLYESSDLPQAQGYKTIIWKASQKSPIISAAHYFMALFEGADQKSDKKKQTSKQKNLTEV